MYQDEDDFKYKQIKENFNYIPQILSVHRDPIKKDNAETSRNHYKSSINDSFIPASNSKTNILNLKEIAKTIRKDTNLGSTFKLPISKPKKSRNDFHLNNFTVDKTTISYNTSERSQVMHSNIN
jgi:hypothetical protein